MKTWKTIIAILLCLCLAVCMAACNTQKPAESTPATSQEETANLPSEPEILDGGWARAASPVVTEALKALFEKAAEGFTGVSYIPVAYLSSQVVAGFNHRFLCQAQVVYPDAPVSYAIVEVYEDPSGNAEITNVMNFDAEAGTEAVPGGWTPAESPEITPELRALLNKAAEGYVGMSFEPLALADTQVVAGTNYRFLCEATGAFPGAAPGYALVTVYEDPEGKAEITDVREPVGEDVGTVQIPNPFINCEDFKAAAMMAGFSIEAPESLEGYPQRLIQVIRREMIQVFYADGDLAEEETKHVLLRKGLGSEDISGDYTPYDSVTTKEADGRTLTLKGSGDLVYLAVWTEDAYSYSVYCSAGMDADAILKLANELK